MIYFFSIQQFYKPFKLLYIVRKQRGKPMDKVESSITMILLIFIIAWFQHLQRICACFPTTQPKAE